jgi:hypothetical protein
MEHIEEGWYKSSYSGNGGGSCVEVKMTGHSVLVRNSRDRAASVLEFTLDEWRAFTAGAHDGEFDLNESGRLV